MPNRAYRDFVDYLTDQPPECHQALRELRAIVLEVHPEAEEQFNYNVPAFTLVPGGKREQQLMIAGCAKHVGFYPHPTTMEHFESELSAYKRGKDPCRFP